MQLNCWMIRPLLTASYCCFVELIATAIDLIHNLDEAADYWMLINAPNSDKVRLIMIVLRVSHVGIVTTPNIDLLDVKHAQLAVADD